MMWILSVVLIAWHSYSVHNVANLDPWLWGLNLALLILWSGGLGMRIGKGLQE